MIPEFNAQGYLPPGVHKATLDEVAERFGSAPELRRSQMESVRWMVELAAQAGIERIVLNGSFTTDILEPNDVDCVLLIGEGYSEEDEAAARLLDGLPFLHINIAGLEEFSDYVNRLYAQDRRFTSKGMIEVQL